VDLAIASMSGSTSQPNLNSVVAALQHTKRDTQLDLRTLDEYSDYWEGVKHFYAPFDTAPPNGTAEVYLHEMPGGQYTNLKEQAAGMGLSHRWPEIARTYAEVNELFGDIVKVTPSSKVVGDMAMFLITRGIQPQDVLNLEPGSTPFPESVIDMMMGGLGQPVGGWPKQLQKVVLGDRKPLRGRPGAGMKPLNLASTRKELAAKLDRKINDDDLYSSLMYPQVFEEYARFVDSYGDVSVLPTPAYFYGLQPGEEISVAIEAGKTLFIKLINVGDVDKDGRRVVNFELNGMARQATVADKSVKAETKARDKADAADPLQIGAPIPGMVTSISCSIGHKVSKGDKLVTLEAMKMYTTINSPVDGVIEEILVAVSDTVESKDLLVRLRA
jgi:pyruvate carboxylase